MSEKDNITPDSQPEGADVTPSGDEGAVTDNNGEFLQQLNKELGKNFKDVDTALKSIKDTFGYVGKRKEDILSELKQQNNGDFLSREEYQREKFFDQNPEYQPVRSVIEAMAKTQGLEVSEVINQDDFQDLFTSYKEHQATRKKQSVLSSNPVMQKTSDHLKEARELAGTGDMETAKARAAQAVLDAYGIN